MGCNQGWTDLRVGWALLKGPVTWGGWRLWPAGGMEGKAVQQPLQLSFHPPLNNSAPPTCPKSLLLPQLNISTPALLAQQPCSTPYTLSLNNPTSPPPSTTTWNLSSMAQLRLLNNSNSYHSHRLISLEMTYSQQASPIQSLHGAPGIVSLPLASTVFSISFWKIYTINKKGLWSL